MRINKQTVFFLILTAAWYITGSLIPYNKLAASLGFINLDKGHSFPISFFLMDAVVICMTVTFFVMVIQGIKKKTLKFQWVIFGILLIFPLFTIWTTVQDLIFGPIAP